MNKYFGALTGNGRYTGGATKSVSPASSPVSMPEKTANWPGVPGKTQGSRSGGAPTTGYRGPFYVKKVGL